MEQTPSFCFVARRNNSLSRAGKWLVLGPLAFLMLVISAAFATRGAWLILPFAGLEFAAVFLAFRHMARHARDFESITIRDDRLVIRSSSENEKRCVEFHPYWVQVDQPHAGITADEPVILRSHGKEVRFGAHLTNAQRIALARRLKEHLRAQSWRKQP